MNPYLVAFLPHADILVVGYLLGIRGRRRRRRIIKGYQRM